MHRKQSLHDIPFNVERLHDVTKKLDRAIHRPAYRHHRRDGLAVLCFRALDIEWLDDVAEGFASAAHDSWPPRHSGLRDKSGDRLAILGDQYVVSVLDDILEQRRNLLFEFRLWHALGHDLILTHRIRLKMPIGSRRTKG